MEEPSIKVTVITVCYNSVETLAATLRSVASQSWSNVEHIVVDGASVDGTQAVINKYRSGIAAVISEPDRGIYDAMNKGLRLARGDIICFLNADDVYATDSVLETVVHEMQDGRLDALLGDVGYVRNANASRVVRRYRSDRFSPEKLAWGWMPAHPGLFLSRKVVTKVGEFKIDYRIAGDFEFIIRAFVGQSLRYRHLPEMLVYMCIGGASTSGLRSKILLNREVLRACRENGLRTNMLKILLKYPLKFLEYFVR